MKNNYKNQKGFSLPEVIVAMFIFVLMMLVVTSVFATMVKTRKQAQKLQKNMENVRYSMELMAKNIRMSSIDKISDVNNIYIYNYSQGKCMHFKFSAPTLYMSEVAGSREALSDCSSASYGSTVELALSNITDTQFAYFPPKDSSGNSIAGTSLGRVTMVMRTATGESIQTTVALRNYSQINP